MDGLTKRPVREEESYDEIETRNLRFSPNSQRLAYSAYKGYRQAVVIDGKEETPRGIAQIQKGQIIFDSPDSLHYLTAREDGIYLVEKKLKSRPR